MTPTDGNGLFSPLVSDRDPTNSTIIRPNTNLGVKFRSVLSEKDGDVVNGQYRSKFSPPKTADFLRPASLCETEQHKTHTMMIRQNKVFFKNRHDVLNEDSVSRDTKTR